MPNLVGLWQTLKKTFKENTKEEKPGGETGIEKVLKSYDKAYDKLVTHTGNGRAQAVYDYTEAANSASQTLTNYLNKLKQLSRRGTREEKHPYDVSVEHLIYGVQTILDYIQQNREDLQVN